MCNAILFTILYSVAFNLSIKEFIYLIGANKTEHSLTDGQEQHGSITNFEKTLILHIL